MNTSNLFSTRKIIPVLIILLLIGAFYGGMKYTQSKSPTGSLQAGIGQRNPQDFENFRNLSEEERQEMFSARGGQRMNANREGFANGEIIAKDEQSITVKLPDGGSKIIFFSETTAIRKMTDGVVADLAEGEQVVITGKQNSDGSITAESIQISPVQIFNRDDIQ